jgi:transcriptional regulator GlxA family with amidase domain
MRVGVLLFDGAEELDYSGPYEVFSVANRVAAQSGLPRPFDLITIGEHAGPVESAGGLRVLPDIAMDQSLEIDLLLVPGGAGTRRGQDIAPTIRFIEAMYPKVKIMASVCTGAFLLARAGLLRGVRATTHWASLDVFRQAFPETRVVDDARFVDEGHIMTAGGITAGIDLALYIVEKTIGSEIAEKTAKRMEYMRR